MTEHQAVYTVEASERAQLANMRREAQMLTGDARALLALAESLVASGRDLWDFWTDRERGEHYATMRDLRLRIEALLGS